MRLSSFVAYEAEEKDYDAPVQPERRRVSSALADEAEKEEAGCSGASAQAECHHAPETEPAEGPDRHSPERRRWRKRSALTRRRRRRRQRRPIRKVDELLPP